jgi:hypothetical protein
MNVAITVVIGVSERGRIDLERISLRKLFLEKICSWRYLVYDALLPPNMLAPDDTNLWHFLAKSSSSADLPDLGASVQLFQPKQRGAKITELLGIENSMQRFHELRRS